MSIKYYKLLLQTVFAAYRFSLHPHNNDLFDRLVTLIERIGVYKPEVAAGIANSFLVAFDRGFSDKAQAAGLDITSSVLDTDPNLWLALQDDPEIMPVMRIRDRLRQLTMV